jgi:hypothetical protein
MADDSVLRSQDSGPSRKTLRLTFQTVDGQVRLLQQERLDMITPPMVGEPPEAGKNSGFWIELRDDKGSVLAHRLIHSPLRAAVEAHSPDGSIKRVKGAPTNTTFEVLLPDRDGASTAVLIGQPAEGPHGMVTETVAAAGSQELARFSLAR